MSLFSIRTHEGFLLIQILQNSQVILYNSWSRSWFGASWAFENVFNGLTRGYVQPVASALFITDLLIGILET